MSNKNIDKHKLDKFFQIKQNFKKFVFENFQTCFKTL